MEDLGEVKNAFKNKIHLRALYLSFTIGYDQEATKERMEKDEAVLNALELDPHLEILEIGDYLGTKVDPNWMMSNLTNLKSLSLRGCWKLDHLPPLGKLPLLQVLTIKFAANVGMVGEEFLGINREELQYRNNSREIIIFPQLKSLQFDQLMNCEEWIGMGGTREEEDNTGFVTNFPIIKIMPSLRSLKIDYCPKLKSLPNYLRDTLLEQLQISGCKYLEQNCKRRTGDEWSKISHIPNIKINLYYVQRDGQLL